MIDIRIFRKNIEFRVSNIIHISQIISIYFPLITAINLQSRNQNQKLKLNKINLNEV